MSVAALQAAGKQRARLPKLQQIKVSQGRTQVRLQLHKSEWICACAGPGKTLGNLASCKIVEI